MPYSWASGLSTDQTAPKAPTIRRDTIALVWPAAIGTAIGYVALRLLGIGGKDSAVLSAVSAGVMAVAAALAKTYVAPPLPAPGG